MTSVGMGLPPDPDVDKLNPVCDHFTGMPLSLNTM